MNPRGGGVIATLLPLPHKSTPVSPIKYPWPIRTFKSVYKLYINSLITKNIFLRKKSTYND